MRHKLIITIVVVIAITSSTSYGMGRAYPYYTIHGVRCYTSGTHRGFGSFGRSYGGRSNWESGGYLALNALRTVAEIQQQNRVLNIVESQFTPQQPQQVVYVPQPVQQAAYTPSRVVYGVQLPPRQPQQQVVVQQPTPSSPQPVVVPPVLDRSPEEIRSRIQQQAKTAESADLKAEIERLKLEKAELEKKLSEEKAN